MTLPDNLIPITVSSGFDLEGNERIHAAKEQEIIRSPFIAPNGFWLAYTANWNPSNIYKVGYGFYNLDSLSYTETASINLSAATNDRTKRVVKNNYLYAVVSMPDIATFTSNQQGVHIFQYNGTSSLQNVAKYQITPSSNFDYYYDFDVLTNGNIVVSVGSDTLNNLFELVSFNGTSFTTLDRVTIGNFKASFMQVLAHSTNKVFVVQDFSAGPPNNATMITSYDCSTGAFVQEAQIIIASPYNNIDNIYYDGHYVYCSNGQIYSFDGTTFTLVRQGTAGSWSKLAISGSTYITTRQSTAFPHDLNAYSFDGTTLSFINYTELSPTGGTPLAGMFATSNLSHVCVPAAAEAHIASQTGIFSWDGAVFTRLAPMEISTGGDTYINANIVSQLTAV